MRTETIIRRLNKAQPHNINRITIDDDRNWAEWKKQVKPEELDLYTPDIEYDGYCAMYDIKGKEDIEMLENDIVEYLAEKSLTCNIIKCSARDKSLYVIVGLSDDGTTNIDSDVIQAFVDYIRRAFRVKNN